MKTIEVAAAIIVNGERIFATQRGYGQFKDGWEFPGGKIEPGETKEAALIREIREELHEEMEELKEHGHHETEESGGSGQPESPEKGGKA